MTEAKIIGVDFTKSIEENNAALADPLPPMETFGSAIDHKPDSPFMMFWRDLNNDRAKVGLPEVAYREARQAFHGGRTPAGALTYVENGEGLRAVRADPVNGGAAYHGEYREIADSGTKWHKVLNNAQLPVVYTTPEYALDAARIHRDAAISKAFR